MNPCVKTEEECKQWISKQWIQNNEEKQLITSNNESEQIMNLTRRIHVCLLIFFNSLFWDKKSDKTCYILIQ